MKDDWWLEVTNFKKVVERTNCEVSNCLKKTEKLLKDFLSGTKEKSMSFNKN
jgi:hypothetical protein